MTCDEELARRVMALARLRVSVEEACRALEDMERLLSGLRGERRDGAPLYYVWEDAGGGLPGEPVRHDPVNVERLGVALDSEGRIVFPWRGRPAGGGKT